jgi:hypothetical protein
MDLKYSVMIRKKNRLLELRIMYSVYEFEMQTGAGNSLTISVDAL